MVVQDSEGFDPPTWRSEAARTVQAVLRVRAGVFLTGLNTFDAVKISRKVERVEYAIRDIVSSARKLESEGRAVQYLNIGDPAQYGFGPPPNVVEAFVSALRGGRNHYAPSEGLGELREAIAERESAKGLSVSAGSVVVTNGVSEALDMVMASIVEDGDEVLLPGPCYPPYASYVRLHGGVPVEFRTDMESSLDVEDLESKITERTVAVCLISPNNPTGAVYARDSLAAVAELAKRRGLYLVCDEIYDRLVFDGKFSGIGSVAGEAPVVLLNGFSKVHMATGWRLGYVAFNDSPGLAGIREHLPKLARVRISCSTPAQQAALEALRGPQDHVESFVSELRKRRDYAARRLDAMPGVSCPAPRGAFYAFPKLDGELADDRQFARRLLEKEGVLVVHGSGFGEQFGSGHFRMVFLPPVSELERALDKIERFVS